MTTLNRLTRRVTICASLAIIAAMATAVPLKPAAADNDSYNGQWRGNGYGHDRDHRDRNWRQGGYGGGSYYYVPQPTYYYQPAPTYYYQPRPYYAQPGINFNVVIP